MEKRRLNEIVQQWRVKAENDLALVRHDINEEHPVTDALCFHCQQAAEKYLKLYLIAHNSDYPKVHDIAVLLRACAAKDPEFRSLQHCSYLTDYAVGLRYPDDFYLPSNDELRKAYQDAVSVRDFVLCRLPF